MGWGRPITPARRPSAVTFTKREATSAIQTTSIGVIEGECDRIVIYGPRRDIPAGADVDEPQIKFLPILV